MTIPHRITAAAWLTLICLAQSGCQQPTAQPDCEGTLFVEVLEDFKLPEPGEAWTFRTPDLWHIATEDSHRFLQMKVPPKRPMMPGVRRPQEYAIYNKYQFRSFSLSCWLRVDRDPAVKRRDACIIFGRQDDTHFYYAHLSNVSDAVHNTLMRVDGETRQSLIPPDRRPTPAITDKQWHKVDVLRNADTGSIEVYVDAHADKKKPPLFSVIDRTYEWGHVAIGSFDDHASFAGLRIKGEARKAGAPLLPDRTAQGPVSDITGHFSTRCTEARLERTELLEDASLCSGHTRQDR